MKKIHIDWECVLLVIIGIFILINVFWCIYAFAVYGNKTINEIPGWALWYMFKGGK